jgi:TRAP-type C4-dicarboxylate transport system permease small subunit
MTKAKLRANIDRWGLHAIVMAVVLTILLFLASLVVIYVGDEYVSPAWDEQSVPAPRTY